MVILPLIFHQFTSCASVIIFYINLIRYCVAYVCYVKTKINCFDEDLQDFKKYLDEHFELALKEIVVAHQKSIKYYLRCTFRKLTVFNRFRLTTLLNNALRWYIFIFGAIVTVLICFLLFKFSVVIFIK